MSDLCEMSELPKSQCAHCLGQLFQPPKREAARTMEARISSFCPCGGWITEGDPIFLVPENPEQTTGTLTYQWVGACCGEMR